MAARVEEWIREYQSGDRSSANLLVQAHQDLVYRVALRALGNRDDALDVAQEVFVRMLKELPRWKFRSALPTWLYRTTFLVAQETIRRNTRFFGLKRAVQEEALTEPQPVESPTVAREEDLFKAIRNLPRRQREVVTLRSLEELSVKETAEVLKIPEGTVKSNFAKAVANLRKTLMEGQGDREEA